MESKYNENEKQTTRHISITAALIFNIGLLTLVVGGLCAWLITLWATHEIHRRAGERIGDMAHSIANQMSISMQERYIDIVELRDLFEIELNSATARQKRDVMERAKASHRYFSWLGVTANDGRVLIGTDHLLEGLSVSHRDWFEGAATARVFFGDRHTASLLNSHIKNADGTPLYLLDIAMPIHSAKGKLQGVLCGHLNWKMFEDIAWYAQRQASTKSRLDISIVNAEGDILFDTGNAAGNIGKLNSQSDGRTLETQWPQQQGMFLVRLEPMSQLHDFSTLNWRIAVREPTSSIDVSVTRMRWEILEGSVLVGLLFSLLGLFVVRPITRPLQALVQDIRKFGETEQMPQSTNHKRISEVSNLFSAFRNMAAKVTAQKKQLEDTQFEIVKTLGRAGEFRDNETGNHVLRMSLCCARLGELAGMDPQQVEMLHLASQMHDVGKIGIPDNVLLKPGKFDEHERVIMEKHCEIGNRILSGMDTPLTVMARTIAMNHHEKWDGSGYPHKLAGDTIPLEARIAAICDVFDALLSDRPYKKGWSVEEATRFLREQSGKHFDPELVDLFLRHTNEFVEIRNRYRD